MGGEGDRDCDEAEQAEASASLPASWEQPDYGGASEDSPTRARHDAFTPARRATFLKHLARYGCLTDAARRTGVSARTIYYHQDKDKAFASDCARAVRMAGSRLELTAFERAVDGVPQLFACGGEVHTRTRYSDGLLRLLLQGADPKKYGPRPGFTRKRLLASERKRIEQDIRAQIAARRPSAEQVTDSLLRKLNAIRRSEEDRKLAAGWIAADDGCLIPPGWVRAEDEDRGEGDVEGEETPRDSM